ncbi:MAG TPA: hypothetical protein VGG44_08400 [Tepidisphaeraceae bacterium]|jgi:hypothetical protein
MVQAEVGRGGSDSSGTGVEGERELETPVQLSPKAALFFAPAADGSPELFQARQRASQR